MSIGHKGMLHAAKVMAVAASETHADPPLLTSARAEQREATGGRPYSAPIPEGARPPQPRHYGRAKG